MKRSRLKNIINKSKSISNKQEVGNPFDEFKKSLPIEVDDNYRLEAAWKAYGSPKDYKTAIWEGLIQPINENEFKLPSISYNEETDEYEYLNQGKDNEIVAKDIRVWDNDIIPFVKELKHGGYVRTFNESKNCWTYSKNSQKEDTLDQEQNNIQKEPSGESVDYLKGGGEFIRKPYSEWKKTIDFDINDDYDLESAYNNLPLEQLEAWRTSKGQTHLSSKYKKENHMTYSDPGYGWSGSDKDGWIFRPSPRQMQEHSFEDYIKYWDKAEPNSKLDYAGRVYYKTPVMFKQGGQMNVIPEGALHAHKNHMEGAGEEFTAKGIPVVDNNGEQQAEIEREEVIFTKDLTDFLEENMKKYNEENSNKDEIAIKVGKRLTKELLTNIDDRTGLIDKVQEKM